MTVMTTSVARPGSRAPWWRAARWMVRGQLTFALWFWSFMLVAAIVAITAVDAVAGVGLSIFQFTRHGALWTGFTLAIILATTGIGVHVASGLTRKAFVQASLATGAVAAVLYALLGAAGLQVEGAVYAANGWPHVPGDGTAESFDPAAGFLTTFVAYTLTFAAGQVSGLLVGMAYYRLGGWRGTAALPLTLAPIYLVGVGGIGTGQWRPLWLGLPPAIAVAVALAVLAAAAASYYLLARRVPIHRVEA